jgi:hypothetical protein
VLLDAPKTNDAQNVERGVEESVLDPRQEVLELLEFLMTMTGIRKKSRIKIPSQKELEVLEGKRQQEAEVVE